MAEKKQDSYVPTAEDRAKKAALRKLQEINNKGDDPKTNWQWVYVPMVYGAVDANGKKIWKKVTEAQLREGMTNELTGVALARPDKKGRQDITVTSLVGEQKPLQFIREIDGRMHIRVPQRVFNLKGIGVETAYVKELEDGSFAVEPGKLVADLSKFLKKAVQDDKSVTQIMPTDLEWLSDKGLANTLKVIKDKKIVGKTRVLDDSADRKSDVVEDYVLKTAPKELTLPQRDAMRRSAMRQIAKIKSDRELEDVLKNPGKYGLYIGPGWKI